MRHFHFKSRQYLKLSFLIINFLFLQIPFQINGENISSPPSVSALPFFIPQKAPPLTPRMAATPRTHPMVLLPPWAAGASPVAASPVAASPVTS